jgi:hypothetical protein
MSPPPTHALLIAALFCGCSDSTPAPSAPSAPAAATAPSTPSPAPEAALRARIRELESQLSNERAQRLQREQEWLRFTQGISELARAAGVPAPEFPTPLAGESAPPAAPAPDPGREERQRRGRALLARLRALFFSDEVAGLDLLEAGELREGALGPVVLRELDPDGRPYGTLCAERLHFEGSQSARTLTLVLEQGYERRGTQRFPFAEPGAPVSEASDEPAARRGTKRIELPEIDPARWIEKVPELFGPSATAASIDDRQHDLVAIRVALNLLLREDASAGWWRLSNLGGVQHDVLREVVLDGFDRDGRQERRLFADRLSILEQSKGVQLLLEQGAQVRGDQKLPFLDDHYRIFLPQAAPEVWAKAGVPVVRAKSPEPAPAKRD